jgi:hypothetical protein
MVPTSCDLFLDRTCSLAAFRVLLLPHALIFHPVCTSRMPYSHLKSLSLTAFLAKILGGLGAVSGQTLAVERQLPCVRAWRRIRIFASAPPDAR